MIRWKYVVPRLTLLIVISLSVAFGVEPLMKWSLVRVGQSATGARIDIGDALASFVRSKVTLSDVAVADPNRPLENLIQADRISLKVDPAALSRRKLIVNQGEIRGLALGTLRESSGTLAREDSDQPDEAGEGLAERGEQWLDFALGNIEQDLEDELESVRLANELSQRWPEEYSQLQARAASLRMRIQRLRNVVDAAKKNPLEAVASYRNVAHEVEQIRIELRQVRGEISRLQGQLQRDKEAIASAKQHDAEWLQEKTRLKNLDGQTLSEYLLGPDWGSKVATAIDWIRWGRRFVPSKPKGLTTQRARGTDIVFARSQPLPDVLIRSLAVQGRAMLEGRPLAFEGIATGLTNDPKRYGGPLEIRLNSSGAADAVIQATLDRHQEMPHDRVLVDCPQLAQPPRALGDPQRFAVLVSPGHAHLWALFDLHQETVSGEIIVKQEPVQLQPVVATSSGAQRLTRAVESALGDIRSLDVSVTVSGTLQKPRWKLHSNVGNQLAQGMNLAVQQELTSQSRELMARAQQRVERQMERIESSLAAASDSVLRQLNVGENEIQRILDDVAGPALSPRKLLGRDSPVGTFFPR